MIFQIMTETGTAGQYYLLEKIAQGGMAEIYKGLAYDLAGIKKTVCIKKILPHIAASREFIDMLVDEAKIAVQLNHGNIAQIYDLGKVGDDYFIVMEFVEGQNLSRLNKRCLREDRRLPVPLACYIIAEVAGGLNYMHRKTDEQGQTLHIIHRDISPQNIVVSYSGTVKIIDFGIAKAASKIGHTESGILKGKFAYMSPEQVRGDTINHQSDLFSLGVILHELLTGKRLFKGSDNRETLRNVRRAKTTPPSQIVDDVPAALDAIVLKALEKDPARRYAHASDLRDDLMKFIYTHHPDFKPSHVAQYIQELFGSEINLRRGNPEGDSATPHLILDKTHSALKLADEEMETTEGKGTGPINWREFMLELDWPDEPVEQDPDDDPEESSVELTTRKPLWQKAFLKRVWITSGLVGVVGLVIGLQVAKHPAPPPPAPATAQPEAKPAPLPASVIVTSNPPGAKIFWDDRETGFITPATLGPFKENEQHHLGLYLDKFRFFKAPVTTYAGQTQRFHVEMAPDYGTLKVLSTPEGASVIVDGEAMGQTPFTKNDMPPDALVTVEIKMEGYEPWHQEVKIGAGLQQLVSAILEKSKTLPIMENIQDHDEEP